MLSSAVLVLAAAMVAGEADNARQEWMKFLQGEWTYAYGVALSDGKIAKGEVTYGTAAKRNAVVAHGKEGDDEWVELIGWQPDTKAFVFVGYGAVNNNYWCAKYDEVTKDKISGVITCVLPDGRPGKGKASVVRVDDNNFEVHVNITVAGEKLVDVGKFTRKKP